MCVALMFSAGGAFASETCAADVNTCTPKQLCEASTSIVNNNKVWSVDPTYVEHVAMSKQLGINCGVVDVVEPTCETDAGLCAVSALCEQATVASGSAKAWSEAAGKAGHVSLAKEYGLACDVMENAQATLCSGKSPSTCNDQELCRIASYKIPSSNTYKWNNWNAAATTEAKKRELTCGVNVPSTTRNFCDYGDASGCADTALCGRGTAFFGNTKQWKTEIKTAVFVKEAKKRGLTCGVVEVNKSCSYSNPAGCNQTTLCFRATKNGTWNALLPYVNEAKMRGLTCGVTEKPTLATTPAVPLTDGVCTLATTKKDGTTIWEKSSLFSSYVQDAKKRGLTCGVIEDAKVSKTRDLPMCPASGVFDNCFGTWTSSEGDKWIGSWKADRINGVATYLFLANDKWKGHVQIGKIKDRNITGGQSLSIWTTGEARFDWVVPERFNSNSTVNEVFPSLTRMFNNLPKHKRVAIQNSLAKKDLYTSTIDGAWGRNTLIGIGRFTAEHLNTINLKSSENVELVLDAIIEQGDLVRTKVAQQAVFDAVAKRDAGATKVASNSANFKDDYTSQSLLKRQQLQYALKKLGFYSSSIDGVWGSGTSSAIVEYAQANGVNSSSPSSVFSNILSKVDVPSSFAAPKSVLAPIETPLDNNKDKSVLKLLLLGTACAMTPNPSACLSGAAGNQSTYDTTPSSSFGGTSSNYDNVDSQCSNDSQCGFREQCVKRLGKGICVKLVDANGRTIKDRNAEIAQCRRNSDCPRKFECNTSLRICVSK
jgi:peptidoglycan hydrolase-like protein with peptidoglycan-binding domain